jgi:transposase
MPALVAIRFNADLKAKYEQRIKAGKAPKQAITAVMRKLIILANALLKKGRKWQTRVA